MNINEIKKGGKTTAVALITLVIIIVILVALFMELATLSEVTTAIGGVTSAAVIFIGLFSENQKK